jgi:hypothetical protein
MKPTIGHTIIGRLSNCFPGNTAEDEGHSEYPLGIEFVVHICLITRVTTEIGERDTLNFLT